MARLISRQEAAQILEVNEQTVSNWVEKGLISGHKIDGRLFIDKNTITCLFDSLQQLAHTEKMASMKLLEAQAREQALDQRIKDVTMGEAYLAAGKPKMLISLVYGAILELAGEDVLDEREKNILCDLKDGKTISFECKKYHISREWIAMIIHKAFRKIYAMRNFSELRKQYKELREHNKILIEQVSYLKNIIEESNEQKNAFAEYVRNNIPARYQGKVGIAKLMEILSTKIRDRDFNTRTLNCLKALDVETIGDLVRLDKPDLLKKRNFGKKCFTLLEEYLDSLGLTFGMDVNAIYHEYITTSNE